MQAAFLHVHLFYVFDINSRLITIQLASYMYDPRQLHSAFFEAKSNNTEFMPVN